MTKRQVPPGFDMDSPDEYSYEGLPRLKYKLYLQGEQRTIETLIALSPQNDPFYIGPTRQEDAEWFAKLWRKFMGDGIGIHLRRFHYLLVSQKKKVPMLDGTLYENSEECWAKLGTASSGARYLKLVPYKSFIDRRNAAAIVNRRDTGTPEVDTESGELDFPEQMPAPPELSLSVYEATQRYQVEIWAEKTTVNDILEPLGERYGVNVITGMGELSITACHLFIERAKADGRPVRILYVSDFDPAGQSMPVAVARKIEFMIRDQGLDLDVQVRNVVLTPEQCEQYGLPRTPIKKTEHRADAFEERHGEGATELDALEALHPGELERILRREIERYWDYDLEQATDDAADPVRDALKQINAKVHRQHAKDIASLRKEYAAVVAAQGQWAKHAQTVWRAIEKGLNAEAPDMSEIDWPEPDEGDEDDDPLYDSARDYVEQIDRYKEHQGKPTERRSGSGGARKGAGRPRKTTA